MGYAKKSLSFEMEWMECEREEDCGIVDGVDGVCVCEGYRKRVGLDGFGTFAVFVRGRWNTKIFALQQS